MTEKLQTEARKESPSVPSRVRLSRADVRTDSPAESFAAGFLFCSRFHREG